MERISCQHACSCAHVKCTKDWGDGLSWHGGISVCVFAGRFGGSRKGGGRLIEEHNCTGYQVEHLCLLQSLLTPPRHDSNLITTIRQQLSPLIFPYCSISAFCSEICDVLSFSLFFVLFSHCTTCFEGMCCLCSFAQRCIWNKTIQCFGSQFFGRGSI